MARRRRGPGWVPDQHGAWAMLAAPVLVGTLGGGGSWLHVLLALAWLVAFLAFNATGLWLKARRRPRYWPPVRAYAVALVVVGGPLLLLDPHLLRWAPVFAPALVVSLWCSWTRRDRTLLNDGVTVLAACAMTVVAWQLGSDPVAAPAEAWGWALVLWVYFFGTAFYVKTMIRERNNPAMLRASIGYHALATLACLVLGLPGWADPGAGWTTSTAAPGLAPTTWLWLAAFFAVLTARAWLVPLRFPRTTPKQLGIGEVVATAVLVALFVLTR